MEQHKIDILRKVIDQFDVNFDSGIVTKKSTGTTGTINNQGRLVFGIGINGDSYTFYVHQIVAFAGGLDLLDKEVNHINGDKLDNRLLNLETVSPNENKLHQRKNGLYSKGKKHHNTRLTEHDVVQIRWLYSTGKYSQGKLSEMFNVHVSGINRIIKRENWKHI